MQGSVRKKGATWSYRIELGMAAGKRNQVGRSGFKTKSEATKAMETRLHGTNVIVAYYIALNTGLRESEVFGLRWEDIDFEKKKIKVCKQLLFQDRKWCFCPLKTKNAYRSVNITDSFCEYMKKLKKHHEENKKLYGDSYKRNFVTDRLERNRDILMEVDDFVNVKLNGDMLTTNSIKFMSRVIKKDLKIDFKFHNLRQNRLSHRMKFRLSFGCIKNIKRQLFIGTNNCRFYCKTKYFHTI